MQTLYPELTKKIVEKAFEKLAEAKAQNKIIPKKQRMGLSAIMGPLDVTQNPQYMQAIMMSAAGNTNAESQGQPNAKRSGSSQAGIKQQNKIAMIYATPLQKMEMKEKG